MNLKKIILINSANFNYLEVDMSKDLFFLGDNGSGKTTVIRAIHYLFSGDVRNLGIPTDKDGFKEYYFRYQNSYMIYTFDDFFILMYKASGEIVKLFSKQIFDKSRIVDSDGNLAELSDIKRYTKEPNLKKTVKSLSEYRDIIYGHDSKYSDFCFTKIKNSEIFIGLFNEIFNIDKSIIDSKSIKKAIQTTLDVEKDVIDFNYDEYLQKIYDFQSKYKFFREFERQKSSIDESYVLKGVLLELEGSLHHLKEKIKYLYPKEEELLSLALKRDGIILKEQDRVKESKRLIEKKLRCYQDKSTKILNSLSLDIEEISRLKEKFSSKNILKNRDLADRYAEIKQSLDALNSSYAKLKSGFEDALQNIEKEIKTLEYRRDKELVREAEDKEFNQKILYKNELESATQKSELELKLFVEKMDHEIALHKQNIVSKEQEAQAVKKEKERLSTKLSDDLRAFKLQKDADIIKEEEDISLANQTITKFEFENKNIANSIENLRYKLNRDIRAKDEEFEEEKQRLSGQIETFESMIYSKEGSFKEYLNEEVDGWESELFPILDTKLLEMDVKELNPSLHETNKLFGISLCYDKLKKILTRDEAEAEIELVQNKLKTAEEVYGQSIKTLKVKFEDDSREFELKIQLNEKEIELKLDAMKQSEQNLIEIEKLFLSKTMDINVQYKEDDSKQNKLLEKLSIESEKRQNGIDALHQSIEKEKTSSKQYINTLQLSYEKNLFTLKESIQTWLKEEKEALDAKIRIKEAKKFETTQDEQIVHLETELRNKHEELRLSDRAIEYLSEYAKVESKITSLDKLVVKLETVRFKTKEFKNKLELKIKVLSQNEKDLALEKKEINLKIKNYDEGLSRYDEMELDLEDVTPKQSDEFLDDVLSLYDKKLITYEAKKTKLGSMLNRINILKNIQGEIDINFKIEELENDFFISHAPNILTKIDEIVEFKNKTLEIVKENGHKNFVNFVNNLLPTKMSIFSDSEDKFFTQVAKINKNLSQVDFGVIKDIRIDTKTTDKKSIAKILKDLEANVSNLSSLLSEGSLFYDKKDVMDELDSLEDKFAMIKGELKGSAISLRDTLDLSLSFNENGKHVSQVAQLKNESSTGGSILLKIAIAISILKLFVKEDDTPFFLIVDEVSRLHSANQERLREFANSKGFGIVFVTPEPTYSKPDHIKYYRFKKNLDDEFEAVELNI